MNDLPAADRPAGWDHADDDILFAWLDYAVRHNLAETGQDSLGHPLELFEIFRAGWNACPTLTES